MIRAASGNMVPKDSLSAPTWPEAMVAIQAMVLVLNGLDILTKPALAFKRKVQCPLARDLCFCILVL